LTFTNKTYESRLRKAGFNPNTWAKHLGVNRFTVIRHCSGRNPIALKFWEELDSIDGLGHPE